MTTNTPQAAALAHCKATVPFLVEALDQIKAALHNAENADSLNGFVGSVLDEGQRLKDMAEDIGSLIRLAKRARS